MGVLRVLEEYRVPVDCIAGTSMGSLVGAAYATGTTLPEMHEVLSGISTQRLFKDKPPRQELSMRRKQDDHGLFVGPEFGVRNGELFLGKGLVTGIQLEAVLRRLSKVKGFHRFDELPIPFRAVATDLVTGKAVVFSEGELANVMRASMSVPGAVAPAEFGGMMLADGMLTSNLPVETARAMGADIVIAVNVGTPLLNVEVEVFAFPPGPRALARAMATIRRRTRAGAPFDVVHAHFGLAALPALAAARGPVVVTLHGNDLFVRRSNLVTRAALPLTALPAAVSRAFSANLPGAGSTRRVAVLPVGIALDRFRPIPRAEARRRLGLDPDGPYLLFPHDPARPLKRFDRAREAAGDVPLLTLGAVAPDEVPYWINAANAVLVPSQDEGFGLSVIEALACGVPAFGTPVGIHPVALHGIEGAYCGEWDPARWKAALAPTLAAADPRVDGRARAELFSADRMADRVVEAWRAVVAERAGPSGGVGGPAYTRRFERIGDRAPDRP